MYALYRIEFKEGGSGMHDTLMYVWIGYGYCCTGKELDVGPEVTTLKQRWLP